MAEPRVAGLLLAAGGGRRYGMPKALVELDGRLFVESSAAVLREGGCAPVVVVLGARADDVRATADLAGYTVVDNPQWTTGMGSSLRVGLDALSESEFEAVAVLPVDVPGVTPAAVRRVLGHASPGALVRATYAELPGHPVLIGREHFSGVYASATGDVGARDYLRSHEVTGVDCSDIATGVDVDRPADLPGRAGA
ncbi:MAG TPA: nucleotidyltransferase family protein [Pseudonocardiaceae bacterium]|jgi:CTP:molybdopterin cytidylyltransferase MocA|nr:nucleotidyltransferase family protein [Pseudonocardiaceae bacterium]